MVRAARERPSRSDQELPHTGRRHLSRLRTPVDRFGGLLRDVPDHQLAGTVIRALIERTRVPPEAAVDVVLRQGHPNGEEPAIARVAAPDAGVLIEVPGVQVDRRRGPAGRV